VVPGAQGSLREREVDEWAKLAAEEPDARGVEWFSYTDRPGARDAATQIPRAS